MTSNFYPQVERPAIGGGRERKRDIHGSPGAAPSPSRPPFVLSPLQQAIDEIRSVATSIPPTYSVVMGASLVARIDGFMTELEEMHLRGGARVPNSLVARLEEFLDSLPGHWPTAFPLRTRIAYVLEDLFTLQDYALDLKVQGRSAMRSTDEGSEWPSEGAL